VTVPETDSHHELGNPPQGSALWWSMLFTPENRRAGFLAATTIRSEIRETVRRPREEIVARVRLGWWHEELGLMADGRPRHPATRRLAAELPDARQGVAALLSQVAAAERDLAGTEYADSDALIEHCTNDGGAYFETIARATYTTGEPGTAALAAVRQLGAAARIVEMIRCLHQDAICGRYYLPADLRRNRGIGDDEHVTTPTTVALRVALGSAADEARTSFARGARDLPAADRADCASVLTMAALSARQLKQIQKRNYDVVGHWTELPPTVKLWTAWNAARRGRRGKLPRFAGVGK
jgi:phytoene synthase